MICQQNCYNQIYTLLTSAFALGPTFLGFPLRSHRNRNFIDIESSSDDDNDSDLEDGDDDDDDDLEMLSNVDEIEFEGDASSDGNIYSKFPRTYTYILIIFKSAE